LVARTHVFLVGLNVGDCGLHVGQRRHEASGEHLGFDLDLLAGEETEALPDRGGMACKLAPDGLADTLGASVRPIVCSDRLLGGFVVQVAMFPPASV
jgi:hypothetical protein